MRELSDAGKVAVAVARELEKVWQAELIPWETLNGVDLILDDLRKVTLRWDQSWPPEARTKISAYATTTKHHEYVWNDQQAVRVSASRGYIACTKDILRRLTPDAEAFWEHAKKTIAQRDQHRAEALEANKKIVEALGLAPAKVTQVPEQGRFSFETTQYSYDRFGGTKVAYIPGRGAKIEIGSSMPLDLTLRILELYTAEVRKKVNDGGDE